MKARPAVWLLGAALALGVPAPARAADEGPATPDSTEHAAGAQQAEEPEHLPTLDGINWYYGMIGEKAGVQPSILWRPPGTPVPYGAQLLNFGVLFGVAYALGKNRVRAALVKRKSGILSGIEEASKMRDAAEARLKQYEERLEHIDTELERVTQHMREGGEADRKRILAEARERRQRMERDARILVEQELKSTREHLYRETVRGAVRSAEQSLIKAVGSADQDRVAREYLEALRKSAPQLRGKV